jgi:hypothetical protein
MTRLLLTGIAALFLATGAAHAESAMVLLQDDDAPRSGLSDTKTEEDFRRWCREHPDMGGPCAPQTRQYYTLIEPAMSCPELLERHIRNQDNGSYLEWRFMQNGEEVRQRILNVICVGVPKSKEVECVVADPTGTPLNVRNQPKGTILFTLRNGTSVVWRSLSKDQKWVKIFPLTGRHYDKEGWVFTDFLDCGYDIRRTQ